MMTSPSDKPGAIYAALRAVFSELEPIHKAHRASGKVAFQYRSVDDFLNVFGPLLCKHGIIIVPEIITSSAQLAEITEKSADGGTVTQPIGGRVSVVVRHHFVSLEDGSEVSGSTSGGARLSGAVAETAAHSFALKTMLTEMFCIPVGDVEGYGASNGMAPTVDRDEPRREPEKPLSEWHGEVRRLMSAAWKGKDKLAEAKALWSTLGKKGKVTPEALTLDECKRACEILRNQTGGDPPAPAGEPEFI